MQKYIVAAAVLAATQPFAALAGDIVGEGLFEVVPVNRDTVPAGTPAAFGAAFGDTPGNEATRTVEGQEYIFVPLTLIPLSEGRKALVSTGASTCTGHPCSGMNVVHYLEPGTGSALYDVRGEWMDLGAAGSFGSPASRWGWTERIAAAPVLYTEGDSVSQGYRCAYASLTELKPEGPVEIATIPVHYSYAGDDEAANVTLDGTISAAESDRSFTVAYAGSESFDALYVRGDDGRYTLQGGSRVPGC